MYIHKIEAADGGGAQCPLRSARLSTTLLSSVLPLVWQRMEGASRGDGVVLCNDREGCLAVAMHVL